MKFVEAIQRQINTITGKPTLQAEQREYWRCDQCTHQPLYFHTESDYQLHLSSSVHAEGIKKKQLSVYSCKRCGFYFTSEADYNEHFSDCEEEQHFEKAEIRRL